MRLISIVILVFYISAYTMTDTIQGPSNKAQLINLLRNAPVGDTIFVKAGNYVFSSNNADSTLMMKSGISLIGSNDRNTKFICKKNSPMPLFKVVPRDHRPFLISNINFIDSSTNNKDDLGLEIAGSIRNFRVTNCRFEKFYYQGILVYPNGCTSDAPGMTYDPVAIDSLPSGVIDNCIFENIIAYGIQVVGIGKDSWNNSKFPWNSSKLGSGDNIFVEDCYFHNYRHAIASNNGSRYVFRHNIVTCDSILGVGNQSIDAHGMACDWECGSRSWEIYDNKIISPGTSKAIEVRGGDGVIFNNDMSINKDTSVTRQYIYLHYEWDITGVASKCTCYYSKTDFINGVTPKCNCKNDTDTCRYLPNRIVPKDTVQLNSIRNVWLWDNIGHENICPPYCEPPKEFLFNRDPNGVPDNALHFSKPDNYSPFPYPHPLRRHVVKGSSLLLNVATQ